MNMKCFVWVFSLCCLHCHLLVGEAVFKYRALGDRSEVLSHLTSNPKKRVLDIGYSAHTWSSKFVTHYVDIRPCGDASKVAFEGDINFSQVWAAVEKDVLENGLFDYCICSHTLEDIIKKDL